MKLDSRILKGKKPLDCFDAENKELIKPFLNKEGYFSNNIENFCLLGRCSKRLLSNVFKERKSCFTDDEGGDWKYFLPAEWVKEPEKKYRPFSLNEFLNRYRLGNTVYFRRIGYKEVKCAIFVEYVRGESPEENQIVLGNMRYTLAYLFKNHELSLEDIWQPFGVLDE